MYAHLRIKSQAKVHAPLSLYAFSNEGTLSDFPFFPAEH